MSRYLTKYQKIKLLKACLDAPINDLEAWFHYPKYQWLYNRLNVAQLQGLTCGPMPDQPLEDQFPVVVKPLVNLYGMGLHSYLIKSVEQFYDQVWFHTGFWTKYFQGEHLSFDCLIWKGKLIRSFVFRGHPKEDLFGGFDYWELVDRVLPPNGQLILDQFEADFSGVINLEIIDSKVIEVHLRMGDLDQLMEPQILQEVVNLYLGKNIDQEYLIHVIPLKVFLFPIFVEKHRIREEVFDEREIQLACLGTNVCTYQLDDLTCAHPAGQIRVVNLTSSSKSDGQLVRERIIRKIERRLEDSTPVSKQIHYG